MQKEELKRYAYIMARDPKSFIEGARSFCKQAQYQDGRSTWSKVMPTLAILGGAYLSLKAGSGWGRYAEQTGNPNGPIKGVIGKMLEGLLPQDQKVYWKGSPEYSVLQKKRKKEIEKNLSNIINGEHPQTNDYT
jgi:hypothetical protein